MVVRRFEAAQRKPLSPEKMTKLLLWIRKNPRLGKTLKELMPAFDHLGWKVEVGNPSGVRFLAPDGATFVSKNLFAYDEEDLGRNYPFIIENSDGLTLEKWVNQHHFQDQVLEDLHMESLVIETERKKLEKEERARVGKATCSCCFGPFMLLPRAKKGDRSLPGVVLHGYKRPGQGYLEGECFGNGWPPFELSSEGTSAYLVHLDDLLKSLEKFHGRLERDEVDTLIVGFQAHLRADTPPEKWAIYLRDAIQHSTFEVRNVTGVRDLVKKKLGSWEPHPERLELRK
jgi:hypothetical protein